MMGFPPVSTYTLRTCDEVKILAAVVSLLVSSVVQQLSRVACRAALLFGGSWFDCERAGNSGSSSSPVPEAMVDPWPMGTPPNTLGGLTWAEEMLGVISLVEIA